MGRRHFIPKRQIVWLALLAILLHAALPFVHGLLQAPARGFYTALCALGSPVKQTWVALDEPTQPAAEQMPRCPLCVAGAHLALNPPALSAPLLRADLQQAEPLAPAQHTLPRLARPAYHSRAPPVLAA